jgi:D-alanine-D-alanine ligase
MRIKLITGPGGHVQGWGDLDTTRMVAEILTGLGHTVDTLFVTAQSQLRAGLARSPTDLAWTSLYHLSENCEYVGDVAGHPWVLDLLDDWGIPYVGSDSECMRAMLDKARTSRTLSRAGIRVPRQWCVDPPAPGAQVELPAVAYPVFVKPRFESESSGIAEASVATTWAELSALVLQIHRRFQQSAIIEEYLPGREFTVSMIGNGRQRRFKAIENVINTAAYRRYPVLTANLKINGWIDFSIPHDRADDLCAVTAATTTALGCRDHVRVDLREDVDGRLNVIDVNGIPGLNPKKSRSIAIQIIYGVPSSEAPQGLIAEILAAASGRQRVERARSPVSLTGSE